SGGATAHGAAAHNSTLAYQWIDSSGNYYIADSGNDVIRKVSSSGVMTTVAGTMGTSGSTGDGGLATNARLNFPTYVVVDSAATSLYIADCSNNAVRKVNLNTGIITTVAGTIGTSGSTGDGGVATSAKLSCPETVGLDSTGN